MHDLLQFLNFWMLTKSLFAQATHGPPSGNQKVHPNFHGFRADRMRLVCLCFDQSLRCRSLELYGIGSGACANVSTKDRGLSDGEGEEGESPQAPPEWTRKEIYN